ncbi:MAG TPA: hypothetical protein DCQ32_10260 [Cyanobacteria bacterium UBA8156]|jgi:hypothetical protein|nr:hypothetical protein [Cyanobacteria bacterium UBA8156]
MDTRDSRQQGVSIIISNLAEIGLKERLTSNLRKVNVLSGKVYIPKAVAAPAMAAAAFAFWGNEVYKV